MNTLSLESLAAYRSPDEVSANVVIFMNIVGALLLGLVVGYERSYHGRAAGMRTYGLVCMASAALVVVTDYPNYWYGGHAGAVALADPTRVIQGIVAGIGFLGAGVIVMDGQTISSLTSAASIWASSTIGVLVGVGFYTGKMLQECRQAHLRQPRGAAERKIAVSERGRGQRSSYTGQRRFPVQMVQHGVRPIAAMTTTMPWRAVRSASAGSFSRPLTLTTAILASSWDSDPGRYDPGNLA